MEFEVLVRCICQRVSFGQTLPEIHDALIGACSEESFFFAWHAAIILGK